MRMILEDESQAKNSALSHETRVLHGADGFQGSVSD
jgi:hypothetical protein